MTKIELQLNVADLTSVIENILSKASNSLVRNPLPDIVAKSIKDHEGLIRSTVDKLTSDFVGSEEFARRIREAYRDAMIGEAVRMGRNAARAAVNAKEAGRE